MFLKDVVYQRQREKTRYRTHIATKGISKTMILSLLNMMCTQEVQKEKLLMLTMLLTIL
jgi:hypothetical protein